MSVLDTFYILFKSDADKAAEGIEKVEDASDGAAVSLDKTDRSVKKVGENAKKAAADTTKLSAATAAADANAKRLAGSFLAVAKAAAAPLLGLLSIAGITNIATGRAENIRELDQFSSKLNSTIGDVDAFQRSVQELGGDGAKALDSLVKIGEKVNEAFSDKDSGARKDFVAWGLSFKDAEGNALGATDAMLALASSIEGVSRAEGLARIKKLGIEDAATIELLLKGRKEVERYITTQKEMGVVTEEQARTTREYYSALGQLGNRLTVVGNGITSIVLPALTRMLNALSGLLNWATENSTLVEGFIIAMSTAITTWLLPALLRLALATLVAVGPWLLLGAAIAAIGVAFALAWEDLQAWRDGQPSLLGELLGDYKTFTANLQALFDALNFEKFMAWISKVATALAPLVAAAGLIAGAMGQGVQTPMSVPPSDPQGQLQWLQNGDWAKPPEGVSQAPRIYSPGTSPASVAGAAFGAGIIRPPGVAAGQSLMNSAASAPMSLGAPATVSNSTTVTIGTVEVNTQATDADGMAAAARAALQKELRSTSSSLDDGVDR